MTSQVRAPFRTVLCIAILLAVSAAAQEARELLRSADAAMQAGQFAEAARQYEAFLRAHPDSREVTFALGVCYVQLGRQSEAVAMLRRYLKLAPDSAGGHAALGIALLDGAQTEEARRELETAVRLNPAQADAAEALARIYLVEGRTDAALQVLQPLARSGASEKTRALLGEAMVKAGRPLEAAQMFEAELAKDAASPAETYAMAAWARLRAGDLDQAAEICERGMRLYPDSEIEGIYLQLPAPLLAQRIGERIKAVQASPDAAELIALGRVLTDADPAQKTRANQIAQQMLSHAVQLAPRNASAHYNLGRVLRKTDMQQALQAWEKALTLDPAGELRLHILTAIGMTKHDMGDVQGAERAFQSALEVNRRLPQRRPEASLEYVRFLQLVKPEEAENVLREVLAWNPLLPQAHVERGKLLAASGEWEKVIQNGEFVLRNAGENKELLRAAHLLLARAYQRLNQPQKAQVHRSWLEAQEPAEKP